MTPIEILAVVAALVVVAVGIQVAARQLQETTVDGRSAGGLVERSTTRSATALPAELAELRSIVAESVVSDAVARTKLRPLLAALGPASPAQPVERLAEAGWAGGRRTRIGRIDAEVTALERAWGLQLGQPEPPAAPPT
ncbi:MAG: hypothetical protein ACFCVK_22525 [Acidimicrobiales bacterium]